MRLAAGRACVPDVPGKVIAVLFRRGLAASSAGSVSFSFIHSNDVPLFAEPGLPLGPRIS
jgi:hypothetical protein